MTEDEYKRKLEKTHASLTEILPWDGGWRWCIVVRNDLNNQWSTATNLSNLDTAEMFDAAAKIRSGNIPQTAEDVSSVEAVVCRLIEADPHGWSTRPCQTCTAISALTRRDFGCVRKAKEKR
jgi:hypothetical protein